MRGFIRFISVMIAFFLFSADIAVAKAAPAGFQDVSGHWAEPALIKAYNDGIIVGDGDNLFPDANTSAAQILTILCRVLGAEQSADISGWGLSSGAWYYDSIAKAAYLGLVSSADTKDLLAPLSRQNAFYLLAEAFQLTEAKPDMSVLNQFSDSALINDTRRQALASLVSQGLIVGHGGRLNVNNNITRAEIITLLGRIVGDYHPASSARREYEHGVILQGSAYLSGNIFNQGVWFDCSSQDVSLNKVIADRVSIRSHNLKSIIIGDSTQIKNLTLAAKSGDVTVTPSENAVVNTLVIGVGNGKITTSGISDIEITGNDRHVAITGVADRVVVSGRNNIVHIRADAQVGKVELLRTARDCRVVVDGDAEELEIIGLRAVVEGNGNVGTMILSLDHCKVDVNCENILDIVDHGIVEASVKIDMPGILPAGDTLVATATIENAALRRECSIAWFVDNALVMESTVEAGSAIPRLSYSFKYSRDMQESADVRIRVKYVTTYGETQEISSEGTVSLENYGKLHWMLVDAPQIMGKVTTAYKGDFTLEWAQANDLDDYDKEVWVNAQGYESSSDYLLWINIAYQRVNIFKNSAGCWELVRTCIVGTGALSTPTRTGVTTVTYRQLHGWTTKAYTVKPVVRFRPGTGYAFHSRLYYPNTSKLRDSRIGFPISLGCIRMYDDDIWYIYDYIPDGTTVVIY